MNPNPENASEEFVRNIAREFAVREFKQQVVDIYDSGATYPEELRKKAARELLPLMTSTLNKVAVIEELCRINPGLGLTIAEQPIFGSDLIAQHGKVWQKEKILTGLLKGDLIIALAVTEPSGGSDVASVRLEARRDGENYILNGSKEFITNGNVADWVLVLARTSFDAEKKHRGLTVFLVDSKSPGFKASKLTGKMGIHPSVTSELSFENVVVPAENIVGEKDRGFYHIMDFFNRSRINVAAMALGIAQGALDTLLSYIIEAKHESEGAFNDESFLFELSELVTKVHIARNLTLEAAAIVTESSPDPMITSIAKKVTSETAVEVSRSVTRLMGARGIYDRAETFFRDAKIMDIWEGTTEMEDLVIARTLLRRMLKDE